VRKRSSFSSCTKAEAREVGGALAIDVRRDRHVVAPENDLLSLRDPFFEEPRRDRALVDIEERYVVIGGPCEGG